MLDEQVVSVNQELLTSRNRMLQETLRPPQAWCRIEDEYPLVLGSFNNMSHCIISKQQPNRVIAHANLWPRTLNSGAERIGLIGNVATDKEFQGQGLMRRLFIHLTTEARLNGLSGLLLWSDQLEFYHRLGYQEVGREYRLEFFTEKGSAKNVGNYRLIDPNSLTEDDVSQIWQLRYPVKAFLNRTPQETLSLLKTPGTHLLLKLSNSAKPIAFWVLGRGYDFAGVVHEWGAHSPQDLIDGLSFLGSVIETEKILLLAPELKPTWSEQLQRSAINFSQHSSALGMSLRPCFAATVDQLFVWGLDSI